MDHREELIEVRRADGENLVPLSGRRSFTLGPVPDDDLEVETDTGRVGASVSNVGRGFFPDSSRLSIGSGSPDRRDTSVNDSPLASAAFAHGDCRLQQGPHRPHRRDAIGVHFSPPDQLVEAWPVGILLPDGCLAPRASGVR